MLERGSYPSTSCLFHVLWLFTEAVSTTLHPRVKEVNHSRSLPTNNRLSPINSQSDTISQSAAVSPSTTISQPISSFNQPITSNVASVGLSSADDSISVQCPSSSVPYLPEPVADLNSEHVVAVTSAGLHSNTFSPLVDTTRAGVPPPATIPQRQHSIPLMPPYNRPEVTSYLSLLTAPDIPINSFPSVPLQRTFVPSTGVPRSAVPVFPIPSCSAFSPRASFQQMPSTPRLSATVASSSQYLPRPASVYQPSVSHVSRHLQPTKTEPLDSEVSSTVAGMKRDMPIDLSSHHAESKPSSAHAGPTSSKVAKFEGK